MNIWGILFAFLLFSGLDIAFILFNSESFQKQIIDVQRVSSDMNKKGAIFAYIFLFFGLYWFILREHRPVIDAVILGAVINGVFETTNYTFFKKWRIETVIKDILWGSVLWGGTTWITYRLFAK